MKQPCLTATELTNKCFPVRTTEAAVPSKDRGCGPATWKGRTHFYTLTVLNSWKRKSRPLPVPRTCGNHINQCLHCEIKGLGTQQLTHLLVPWQHRSGPELCHVPPPCVWPWPVCRGEGWERKGEGWQGRGGEGRGEVQWVGGGGYIL